MRTVAEHIYDIAYNSIKAKSSKIILNIEENIEKNYFKFSVKDNGEGIAKENLEHIYDPFFTSREKKIRKVGLGIPLLKQNAELTTGSVKLESKLGEGTYIEALFKTDSIDMIEIGDISGTLTGLLTSAKELSWVINLKGAKGEESISTQELEEALNGLPINNLKVVAFIKEMTNNMCKEIFELV